MTALAPGDPAPPFELLDQGSNTVSLSDFAGRKLLVYFYPKAGTAGCTKQSCSVRDSLPDLRQAKTSAVGISPDPPQAQDRFNHKYDLGFPLLSDPDHSVAEAYGAWGERSMYGRNYMGIIRSAFLIDEKGRIERAWYKVSPAGTVPKVLDALKG